MSEESARSGQSNDESGYRSESEEEEMILHDYEEGDAMSDDDETILIDEEVFRCQECHRLYAEYDMIHDALNDERICFNCAY